VADAAVAGPACHFYSKSRVFAGFSTFSNAAIGRQLMTGHLLIAAADCSGGKRGKCCYNWCFSRSPINAARLQPVAVDARFFTPTRGHADGYIACQMIPGRADDVVGAAVLWVAPEAIQLADPPFAVPNCPTDAIVGRPLKFHFQVDILMSLTSGTCGFEVMRTGASFTPRAKHVGRVLRVVADGCNTIIGEVKAATRVIMQVEVTASRWVVGECASISVTHKYVDPDKIEIVWLRWSDQFQRVITVNTPEYVLTIEDAEFSIQVFATPLDALRNKLVSCQSNRSPIVCTNHLLAATLTGTFVEDTQVAFECSAAVHSVQ
jgi:hypothetical protein